jgi:hypothetical protein
MLSTIRQIERQPGKQNNYMHPSRAITRELVSSIFVTGLSAGLSAAFVIPRPHFTGTAKICFVLSLSMQARVLVTIEQKCKDWNVRLAVMITGAGLESLGRYLKPLLVLYQIRRAPTGL